MRGMRQPRDTTPDVDILLKFQKLVDSGDRAALDLRGRYSAHHISESTFQQEASLLVARAGQSTSSTVTAPRTVARADSVAGFMFFCNSATQHECLSRSLFGLHKNDLEKVNRIGDKTPLYLYNFSTRTVYGAFRPASAPGYNLDPGAWQSASRRPARPGAAQESPFPAQIRICRDGIIRKWEKPHGVTYEAGAQTAATVADLERGLGGRTARAAPETEHVRTRAQATAPAAAPLSQASRTPPLRPPPVAPHVPAQLVQMLLEVSGASVTLGASEAAAMCKETLRDECGGQPWPADGTAEAEALFERALDITLAKLASRVSSATPNHSPNHAPTHAPSGSATGSGSGSAAGGAAMVPPASPEACHRGPHGVSKSDRKKAKKAQREAAAQTGHANALPPTMEAPPSPPTPPASPANAPMSATPITAVGAKAARHVAQETQPLISRLGALSVGEEAMPIRPSTTSPVPSPPVASDACDAGLSNDHLRDLVGLTSAKISVETSASTGADYGRNKGWAGLTDDEKSAAAILGFDETKWDAGETTAPCLQPWAHLCQDAVQMNAAVALGYTQEIWDAELPVEMLPAALPLSVVTDALPAALPLSVTEAIETSPPPQSRALSGFCLFVEDHHLDELRCTGALSVVASNASKALEHTHIFLFAFMEGELHGAYKPIRVEEAPPGPTGLEVRSCLHLVPHGRLAGLLELGRDEVSKVISELTHTGDARSAVRGLIPPACLRSLLGNIEGAADADDAIGVYANLAHLGSLLPVSPRGRGGAHGAFGAFGASGALPTGGALPAAAYPERASSDSVRSDSGAGGGGVMIVLDGASIASAHCNLNGGYLNVDALKMAIKYYAEREHEVCCLVPRGWTLKRAFGETDDDRVAREQLLDLFEAGWVRTMPDDAKSDLPPLASWVLLECDTPAVIVSNDSNLYEQCIKACVGRDAQTAMRSWHKQWVCAFSFKSMSTCTGLTKRFEPVPFFSMPFVAAPLAHVGYGLLDTPVTPLAGTVQASLRIHFASLNVAMVKDSMAVDHHADIDRLLDALELPAVAAFRAERLCDLAKGIHRHGHAADGPWGFVEEKTAWDVLNKLIFFCKQEQHSSSIFQCDAVIPSALDKHGKYLVEFLSRQMRSAYRNLSLEEVEQATVALMAKCTDAAHAVRAHATDQKARWRVRLAKGTQLSDAALGMRLDDSGGNDSEAEVIIKWMPSEALGAAPEGASHSVTMYRTILHKLKASYERCATAPHDRTLCLTRIFAMAVRYDTLSQTKSGYQAALPPPLMGLLESELGARHECFASPLNHALPSFCSVFHDADRFFGSSGNFFAFEPAATDPAGGVYECNPPFDTGSVMACLFRIAALLAAAKVPLTFVLIIPEMQNDCDRGRNSHLRQAFAAAANFLRRHVEVKAHEHIYQMGLQHRRTGEAKHWRPEKPSVVYFYQNDAGAGVNPVDAVADKVPHAFDN